MIQIKIFHKGLFYSLMDLKFKTISNHLTWVQEHSLQGSNEWQQKTLYTCTPEAMGCTQRQDFLISGLCSNISFLLCEMKNLKQTLSMTDTHSATIIYDIVLLKQAQ